MSVAKTSVQVAVAEGTTIELIGLLTQFITKYRCNTGLNINEIQKVIPHNNNIPEISNPEYHKPKVVLQNVIKRQQEISNKIYLRLSKHVVIA